MVGLVHSSPVHKNNSTSTRLRVGREPAVNRYDGDNPTVAWTLLRVLDSMAHTLEGPGAFFPRREFRTIMGSMFRLDRGLMDSQVGVGWGSRNVTYMRQSLPGEGLEGGYRLLQSWRGSKRRLGKPAQLVSPASLYVLILFPRFLERNATVFPLPDGESLLAYQPCNYVSKRRGN